VERQVCHSTCTVYPVRLSLPCALMTNCHSVADFSGISSTPLPYLIGPELCSTQSDSYGCLSLCATRMRKEVVFVLYAGAGMEQETAEPLQIYPPSQLILVPARSHPIAKSFVSALCTQHLEQQLLLLSITSDLKLDFENPRSFGRLFLLARMLCVCPAHG